MGYKSTKKIAYMQEYPLKICIIRKKVVSLQRFVVNLTKLSAFLR